MSEESRQNVASKRKSKSDFTDITLFGTPIPQAASTARRKNTLPPRFGTNNDNGRSYMNETTDTADSSLGLLHNISSLSENIYTNMKKPSARKTDLDTERELARKLLQKCSEPRIKNDEKTDKENDVNVQNIISRTARSSSMKLDKSGQSFMMEKDSLFADDNPKISLSSASVVFEPREMTARSSEMSKTESFLPNSSQTDFQGLVMNSTAAEMMEQFAGEEFQSNSHAMKQLMADELSWRENNAYALPLGNNNPDKEHLEFSCFSGIIGDFDLSLESDSGRRVSIGEYFKRKCGNIGDLSESGTAERPSLGFSIRSPKKREKLEPLVNVTGMTNVSESFAQKEKENQIFSDTVDMTKENSIMSLSSIAQVLENIHDGTPRKMVDLFIMAKKKRKNPNSEQAISDTYTVLPSGRSSMPVSSSKTLEAEKLENETSINDRTLKSQRSKLSLDSRTLHTSSNKNHSYEKISPKSEKNSSPKPQVLSSTFLDRTKIKENKSEVSFPELKPNFFNSSSGAMKSPIPKYENLQEIYIKKGSPTSVKYDEGQRSLMGKSSAQSHQTMEELKNENVSVNKDSSVSSNLHTSLEESVKIGKETQELCMCVVGIKKEIDLDVINKGDRWIICSVSLNQIQGDSEAIELLLPLNVLVKPDSSKALKVEVKISKMTTPILAVLNITTSDFVTQSRWISKYIICFVPEELQVDVLTPSSEMELNFGTIAENESQIQPITFENKNCVDLPLFLCISQNEPATFSIEKSENETEEDNSNSKFVKLFLKSRERCTINVKFQGVSLNLFNGSEWPINLQKVNAKLILQSNSEEDQGIVINKVPLSGSIGVCKLNVVNTKLPILINKMEKKSLTFSNSGSIGILLSAMVVENGGQQNEKPCDDFVVKPETLFLQNDESGSFDICYMPRNSADSEKQAMLKITTGRNSYLYPVIGKTEYPAEETYDSFQCESLQHLRTMSSPNSQYIRSPNSGRDSPGSSVSSSTIAGDVIPLRATHSSLAWTSVKVGKSDSKEITIRNTSNNKIKLCAYIMPNDQSFKFARERHSTSNILTLTLQPAESKTLTVIFNPRAPGAATGKLYFQHYSQAKEKSESRPSKVIPLFGYGGSTKLEISKAYKDIGGQMWLSLGKMSGGSLEAKIKLENLGDLTCYVKLKLIPKAVYPSMACSWSVEPSELLLNPNEGQWVTLDFRPRKEDLQLLSKNTVCHVGTLKLTYGDEPTRLRIRRLFNKSKESAPQNRKDNEFWNVIYPICKSFPGEAFIRDITLIRDSNSNLGDLCRGVHYQELKLTVESNSDETMSMLQDDMDETQTFYSLCSDSYNDITVAGDSYLPAESVLEPSNQNYIHEDENAFIVQPTVLMLTPSIKNEATIVISTSCKVAQPFETDLINGRHLISVIPTSGMIPTGRSLPLKIHCKKEATKDFDAILRIYTANDKRDVMIKVCNKQN